MQNAFNDANFHTFNETMRQAWDKQPWAYLLKWKPMV
jgi:hypothetical protein